MDRSVLAEIKEMRVVMETLIMRLNGLEAVIQDSFSEEDTKRLACIAVDPISTLSLPTRASRVLLRMGVRTVGDLLTITEKDIRQQLGAGKATICQIKDSLHAVGYKLREV